MEKQMPRVSIWTNDTDEHIANFGILMYYFMLSLTHSSSQKHKFRVQSCDQHSGLPVVTPCAGKTACGGTRLAPGEAEADGAPGSEPGTVGWHPKLFGQQEGPEQLWVPTSNLRATGEGSTRDGQRRGQHQPWPPSEQGTAPSGPSGDTGFQLSLM